MIYEVKMFAGKCDNCGVELMDGSEYSCLSDAEHVQEEMSNAEWHTEVVNGIDVHYCSYCFDFDDNDNLIISQSRKR